MTNTETRKFQMVIRTAQGAWINYGRPMTAEQVEVKRFTSNGTEGQHYRFEAV